VLGAALLVVGVTPFAVGVAGAQDALFVVNSQADAPDVDLGDGSCADDAGECTLRAAVMEANASPMANTVQIPAGTYELTGDGPDAEPEQLDETSADLDVLAPLTIVGSGNVTIDAAGIDRVFDVRRTSLALRGVDVTGGAVDQEGGAIRALGSSLSLDGVTVDDNTANGDGAGVHVTAGTLTVTNSTFERNVAGRDGGALFIELASTSVTGSTFARNTGLNGGAVAAYEPTTFAMTNAQLIDNMALENGAGVFLNGHGAPTSPAFVLDRGRYEANHAQGSGGAVFVEGLDGTGGDATLAISGLRFDSNTGYGGGAVFVDDGAFSIDASTFVRNSAGTVGGAVYGYDPLVVTASTFLLNEAGTDGGALLADDTLRLNDVGFEGNTADGNGGAVSAHRAVTISASRFSGNDTEGSGGALRAARGAPVRVTGSTFDNNLAVGSGGAIGATSSVWLQNSTVSGNTGYVGGGIDATDLALSATTVVRNSAADGGGIRVTGQGRSALSIIALNGPQDCDGTLVDVAPSLDSDGSCSMGDSSVTADPLLGPLSGTGAATTHPLGLNSPARDIGGAACTDVDGSPLNTDQTGAPRPTDGTGTGTDRCDAGSIEAVAVNSPTTTTTPSTTLPSTTVPPASTVPPATTVPPAPGGGTLSAAPGANAVVAGASRSQSTARSGSAAGATSESGSASADTTQGSSADTDPADTTIVRADPIDPEVLSDTLEERRADREQAADPSDRESADGSAAAGLASDNDTSAPWLWALLGAVVLSAGVASVIVVKRRRPA